MHLIFEIIFDRIFNKRQAEPVILLTDSGWPITLYPNKIHVHTPYLTVSDGFGIRYQHGFSHQVHGHTSVFVNKPHIGQMLYFNNGTKGRTVSPRQKISQIYGSELARVSPKYLKAVFDHCNNQGILITDLPLMPNTYDPSLSHNLILSYIISHTLTSNSRSWVVAPIKKVNAVLSFLLGEKRYTDAFNDLVFAGLIEKDGDQDTITVQLPAIILFMEALHHRFPLQTEIDKNGIIKLAS